MEPKNGSIENGAPRGSLFVLDHPPTVTFGRRCDEAEIQSLRPWLHRMNIQHFRVGRGGQSTYHDTGQIIVWPVLPIKAWRLSIRSLVCSLEAAMVDTLATLGIAAYPGTKHNLPVGVWAESSNSASKQKLGQIGLTVHQGITRHGLSFNYDPNLTPFEKINACGLFPPSHNTKPSRFEALYKVSSIQSLWAAENSSQPQAARPTKQEVTQILLEAVRHRLEAELAENP